MPVCFLPGQLALRKGSPFLPQQDQAAEEASLPAPEQLGQPAGEERSFLSPAVDRSLCRK